MLLQKTLHMSQSLEECKSRLASIHSYRRHLAMVTHANVTSSKTLDFGFRGPLGFEGHTVISTLESDRPEQVAFESWGGNIELMGLVEFEEVRPDCTEVSIAVYYEIKNRFYAWLDRRFGFVEAFLNAELRSLRAHFEGIAAPVPERMPVFAVFEPVSA
ncbi:MAG TPA: hypothetical protein VGQ40_03440 [Chthoniobacterales bacterium]|nr:hypothetical protein [Chthoniobacterales bacterium]